MDVFIVFLLHDITFSEHYNTTNCRVMEEQP